MPPDLPPAAARRTSTATEAGALRIPLAGWVDRQLAALAQLTGSDAVSVIDSATLLGERAMINGFTVGSERSAGGGCRWLATRDGYIAINLSRPEDGEMLPALFGSDAMDAGDAAGLADQAARHDSAALVAQGRLLGLALAHIDERPASDALHLLTDGVQRKRGDGPPLIIDLSALWAGPLASHLLALTGARVIKVESRNRPDRMREGDPGLFDLLNQGKDNVAVDLRNAADRAALVRLIGQADGVIEAARPRALKQLGIDADALVRATPGLVWLSITGHGVGRGIEAAEVGMADAAQWVGFGDDTAVAGGLSAAMREASRTIGFVGDAIGDPLSGVAAARAMAERLALGVGGRMILSMSGVVAEALASERARDAEALNHSLRQWAAASDQPFPGVPRRASMPATALGADTQRWLL